MAFMKFYVGNEVNASSHRDGIYIAVDTKKIFYNGSAYGGSEVDLSNYYTIAQVNSKIGTNVYTGANYISKETNLTEAVLQLDEEIKATNDNLALEHTNAEATYAKKTELTNVNTNVNFKIVNAKLSMASWTSGANATKLTFTGLNAGLSGTPAIFFSTPGLEGNTIPTRSCIRFEGCYIYQDSNGFYVSLPEVEAITTSEIDALFS